MYLNKIVNWISNPLKFFILIKAVIKKKFIKFYEKKAINFFKKKDIYKYFLTDNSEQIKPNFIDLKNLYDLIVKRKPRCILEFGVGFSTICIALALKENKKKKFIGKSYTVDTEKKWLENTKKNLPDELKEFVEFHHSSCSISKSKNQLVSLYDNLPNISPNFIYLDGPGSEYVQGSLNGLSFSRRENDKIIWKRRIVAADPLLYESTSPSDFYILIDRRYLNADFLINNLKYEYKIKKDLAFGFVKIEKKYQPYP